MKFESSQRSQIPEKPAFIAGFLLYLIINFLFTVFHHLPLDILNGQSCITKFQKAPDIVTLKLSSLESQPDSISIEKMPRIQAD